MKKMKVLTLSIGLVFMGGSAFGQFTTSIPSMTDQNFINAVFSARPDIDLNNNSNIEISEANNLTGLLPINNRSISNLDGIEEFTSITILVCNDNQITNLNLSQNTALKELNAQFNNLVELNLELNSNLEVLLCNSNNLIKLNTFNLKKLWRIDCSYNHLTELNFSSNDILSNVVCNSNNLTCLNIKNAADPNYMGVYSLGNPNLFCIEVTNPATSASGLNSWANDSWSSYSTNCGNACSTCDPLLSTTFQGVNVGGVPVGDPYSNLILNSGNAYIYPTTYDLNNINIEYEIQVSSDVNFIDDVKTRIGGNTLNGGVNANHYGFNQLQCGTNYYARVRVKDNGIAGCWSSSINFAIGASASVILDWGFSATQTNLDFYAQSIGGNTVVIERNYGVPSQLGATVSDYQFKLTTDINSLNEIDLNGSSNGNYFTDPANASNGNSGIVSITGLNLSCSTYYLWSRVRNDFDNDGNFEWETCWGTPKLFQRSGCTPSKPQSNSTTKSNVLSVYPNPFADATNVKVDAEKEEVLTITISDLTGKVLYTSNNYTTNSNIQLGEELDTGMYLMQLSYGENSDVVKIIKK